MFISAPNRDSNPQQTRTRDQCHSDWAPRTPRPFGQSPRPPYVAIVSIQVGWSVLSRQSKFQCGWIHRQVVSCETILGH